VAEETKPKCDVDPVCNLDLKAMHAQFAYDFEDQTYWFCSEACRDQFAVQPQKFIQEGARPVCKVDPVCSLDLKAMHGKFAYDFEDETSGSVRAVSMISGCTENTKGQYRTYLDS
jgi:Cu+-exporting ATPase